MLNDLRFAFRMMATHPWFSGTIVATLALCIGVNTTVFTLVNAALFKPVPLPNGSRLVVIAERVPSDPNTNRGASMPEFLEYRSQTKTLAGIEASSNGTAVIGEKGIPPERYRMASTTTGLFRMLEVPPVMGKAFTDADGLPGSAPVALVGYSVWQKRYGGAPDVVGRVVTLNGVKTTIIGVMPDVFRFPQEEDVWIPIVQTAERLDRNRRDLMVFGLLRPGEKISAAQAELGLFSAQLAKAFPDSEKDHVAIVQTFHEAFNGGPIKSIFLLMLGAVAFVLLIACANVTNMMLSRAQARSREIAVRAAIGASRWQIIRQLLVECVLLSTLGGLVGLVLARFGVHQFDLGTQDVGKPYWVLFEMDWRAFSYFAGISIMTGIIFGIVPAIRSSRVDLNTALKDGTAGGTQKTGRLSGVLVAFQFALTVILLAGAGVMIKSLLAVESMNAFVPAQHLLTARVSLPDGKGERYESPDSRWKMHQKILERLRALPGVDQVSLTSEMPGLGSQDRNIEVEGRPNPNPKDPPRGTTIFASPNYLSEIGLPLQEGRALNDTDGNVGKEAAVVTRGFAAAFWPSSSALGRRFRFINDDGKPAPWNTVVGICADIKQNAMEQSPPPLAYLSDRQEPWAWLGILVHSSGDPAGVAASVRTAMQGIDPDLPLFEVRTLPDAVHHQFWFLKLFGTLFFTFAAIALLMASVGIYAVVAQNTARRTREIGIRMALGASASRVVKLVLSRGLLQLGIGLGIGLAGAVAATRLMRGLPGLVSPDDPRIFLAVVLLLMGIGLFACWLPARRAASIAPTEALRTD
jgi:predicted permease